MTLSFRTLPALVALEISLIVGVTLGITPWGIAPASASVATPAPISSVDAPAGVLLDSLWLTDSNGVLWALGTTSTNIGTLVSYSPVTHTFTTSTAETGVSETLGGSLFPGTNTAVFSFRKTDGTIRQSVFNLVTRTRTTTRTSAIDETNTRALTFNSTGAYYIVGTSQNPAKILKFDSSTSNANGASNFSAGLNDVTAFINNGSEVLAAVRSTPVKLVPFSKTNLAIGTVATLPAGTPALVDPLVVGTTAYLGTDATPGRITAIDIPTRTVLGSATLASDESGARNLALDSATGTVYLTTETPEGSRLVSFSVGDLQRLGHRDLRGTEHPTTIHIRTNRLTIGFSGVRGLETFTIAKEPDAPSDLTVSEGDQTLTVEWTAPDSQEPITEYVVTAASDRNELQCSTADTRCTFTGLSNGTDYSLSVVARSVAGDSVSASLTGNPFGLPEAPDAPRVTRGDVTIAVSWDEPGNHGGRPILEYTATAIPSGQFCVTSSLSCTIEGIANGVEQTVRVTARNLAGASSESLPSEPVTPAGVPGTPTIASTTGADGAVDITWTEPENDGGAPITLYRVRAWCEADIVAEIETEYLFASVNGLENGREYRVTVHAVTAVGEGAASIPGFATPQAPPVVEPPVVEPPVVDPRVEATVPSAPSALAVIGQTRTHLRVGWVQLDSGGAPIQDYRVLRSRFKTRGYRVVADAESSTPWLEIRKPRRGSLFIRVSAVNVVGESQPSSPKRVYRR